MIQRIIELNNQKNMIKKYDNIFSFFQIWSKLIWWKTLSYPHTIKKKYDQRIWYKLLHIFVSFVKYDKEAMKKM